MNENLVDTGEMLSPRARDLFRGLIAPGPREDEVDRRQQAVLGELLDNLETPRRGEAPSRPPAFLQEPHDLWIRLFASHEIQ